jgi:hypothetical protein
MEAGVFGELSHYGNLYQKETNSSLPNDSRHDLIHVTLVTLL